MKTVAQAPFLPQKTTRENITVSRCVCIRKANNIRCKRRGCLLWPMWVLLPGFIHNQNHYDVLIYMACCFKTFRILLRQEKQTKRIWKEKRADWKCVKPINKQFIIFRDWRRTWRTLLTLACKVKEMLLKGIWSSWHRQNACSLQTRQWIWHDLSVSYAMLLER